MFGEVSPEQRCGNITHSFRLRLGQRRVRCRCVGDGGSGEDDENPRVKNGGGLVSAF